MLPLSEMVAREEMNALEVSSVVWRPRKGLEKLHFYFVNMMQKTSGLNFSEFLHKDEHRSFIHNSGTAIIKVYYQVYCATEVPNLANPYQGEIRYLENTVMNNGNIDYAASRRLYSKVIAALSALEVLLEVAGKAIDEFVPSASFDF